MVDPFNITNFNRDKYELEEFLLFCIVVAGKTAYIQADKLNNFLTENQSNCNINYFHPFEILQCLKNDDKLLNELIKHKLGQYNKINSAFEYLIINPIDLFTCSIDELEQIPGVGPKTSRFFLLHSRDIELAVLDTHILKYLKQFDEKTPKVTPSNKSIYKKYELLFLEKCREQNKKPAELDLELWKSYAKRISNEN